MKTRSLFFLMALSMSACKFGNAPATQKADVFKDTVSYTIKTVHERAGDCGSKADSACTVLKIIYPFFKGQPALNDTLKSRLLRVNLSDSSAVDTNLKMMTVRYLKDYANFKKYNKSEDRFFMVNTYAKVVNQDSSLLSVEYGGYVYEGGAHGADFTEFINWNPKSTKKITLDDILIAGYKTQLNKVAERIFRKEEKLKDTSSLSRDYFFKDNKFALSKNYLLTPIGIRFVYNEDEIKPYAAGQTEIIIPYRDIKTLIRPNAVVAHYIK